MDSTYFKFDNKYYKQIFRTPMESPISPIIADLVMQDLEVEIIKKLDFTVPVYYRYLDDTILFIPKDKINSIVDEFNNYHERLKFTFEIENNNSIPFLNILIIRNNDNTIYTNWYRKNTFSGRSLNYCSNHPIQYKFKIIKNLVDSTILLSNKIVHVDNLNIIKEYFILNNYPTKFIDKYIKKRTIEIYNKNNTTLNKMNPVLETKKNNIDSFLYKNFRKWKKTNC